MSKERKFKLKGKRQGERSGKRELSAGIKQRKWKGERGREEGEGEWWIASDSSEKTRGTLDVLSNQNQSPFTACSQSQISHR